MAPTPPPITSTATRARAWLSQFGHFLGEIADVLARWSWWRLLGLSLLILIAGAMLDDFFIPHPKSNKVSQTIRVENGSDKNTDKDRKVTVKIGGAEVTITKDGKTEKVSTKTSEEKAESQTSNSTRPVIEDKDKAIIPAKEAQKQSDNSDGTQSTATEITQKAKDAARDAKEEARAVKQEVEREARDLAREAAREAARTVEDISGSSESETAELEANLEKIIHEVLTQVKTGKTPVIQVETNNNSYAERSEPFKALAAFLILSSWILKLIGGSRLREQAATARATIATESAEAQSLQRQIAEAKLLRMQAQVEPHFLFNTLAALERLIEINPTRALAMSQALSQWLRALLPQMKEGQSTLGHEANLVQSYLQLMQMRMGERLAFFIDIPETLRGERLPSMLLQPLVENSIKHGLESKKQGGEVRIKARRQGDWLELTVEDTGVGFASNPSTGNGLTNLRERLELIYNGRAMVSITPRGAMSFSNDATEALTGTVITIKLPANQADKS
jgi:signal transduction histidine kinase